MKNEIILEDYMEMMYGNDDLNDIKPQSFTKSSNSDISIVTSNKFSKVTIDGKEIIIPSAQYIDALEKELISSKKEIKSLKSKYDHMTFNYNSLKKDIAVLQKTTIRRTDFSE